MSDITGILAGIAALEDGVTTPAGATALAQATPRKPTYLVGLMPVFLNLPRALALEEVPNAQWSFGRNPQAVQQQQYTVDCRLLFAAFDPNYQVAQQLLWTDPVIAAFQTDPSLGGSAETSQILDADFRPWTLNGQTYICSNFVLRVTTKRT